LDPILTTLSVLFFILIIFGLFENYYHQKALSNIPIRIHVNGTRGKSSVTRLIAAGLRGGKLKTFAKTTGTTPRIINEHGKDVEIHRLRSASIGEQVKLIRYFSSKKPDALVIECMAVNPQYQWVSEQSIVKSTIGVITNVRPDHLDEMGTTNNEIAYSLSNTIPFNSKVITAEHETFKPLLDVSISRNSIIEQSSKDDISDEYLNKFPFIEHPENIALALKVCLSLGIDKKMALNGMLGTIPDPGSLFIWDIKNKKNNCKFISGFAANDPSSTKMVWNLVSKRFNTKSCIFLNTRNDRRYRTIQLMELVLKDIKPDLFIVRADNIKSIINNYEIDKDKIIVFDMLANPKELVDSIINLNDYYVLGIGNIVDWGERFIKELKEYT
tara:strand:- start:15249 stop:16403 length:1155 start_codon:yes stop_codon:yes gene_type:complete